MSRSTSHSPAHKRGAHGGGGGSHHGDEGGGGGGGGGGGKLVKVAFARNQAEAEMLQGLLSEVGIVSVLKRSRGFDAPEFLAAGPRDVLVDSAQAKKAKDLLAETLIESEGEERAELTGQLGREQGEGETSASRLALWVGAAFLAAVILIWVLYELS
jgi:hypothetical protein